MRFVMRLEKSVSMAKYKAPSLGSWGGMTVIAIGPMGGKIVGYGANGKPIYAGSKQAEKLTQTLLQDKVTVHAVPKVAAQSVTDWLMSLGFPVVANGDIATVSDTTGQMIADHFGVSPQTKAPKVWHFKVKDLVPHLGQPLKPLGEEQQVAWAAEVAAGEHATQIKKVFPDLATLKQVDAGKFAGSHGNKLFVDESGKKFIFKDADPTIARAEEAAARIGQLVMPGKVAPAKYVKLGGKPGVLVGEVGGSALNESNHSNPGKGNLQHHFDDVIGHHIVDWLTSNHDGHAGNFLSAPEGLNGIDKGQAWKFFGKDKLDVDYKPNASAPIYNSFWKMVQSGEIKGDVIGAASKALAAAKKITPEQFAAIITPYVLTAAGKQGFDAQERIKQMTDRLVNLQQDWEGFLSKVLGKKVTIPVPGEDNFETMPEAKEQAKPEPKPEPAVEAPKVIAEPAKPVVVKPAPGWPLKKGKQTVHHPGDPPPPGMKWPKGAPGVGFTVETDYKGKTYTVAFTHDKGEFAAVVAYPDGTTKTFDSPNKASDSLYLFHNGLNLDMTGTEKKEKGISLPAAKAFGFLAFADELAATKGGEKSPDEMTVKELEAAKVVTPETPSLESKPEPLTPHLQAVKDAFDSALAPPPNAQPLVTAEGKTPLDFVKEKIAEQSPPADPSPSLGGSGKKKKKTKSGVAVMFDTSVAHPHTSVDQLPDAVAEKMKDAFAAAKGWAMEAAPNGAIIGAKPTNWPGWVPPTGVVMEAFVNGEKHFLLVSVAGHDKEGNAGKVRFSLFQKDGTVKTGASMPGSKAMQALQDVAKLSGIEMDDKALKAAFGLDGANFAAGTTLNSIDNGLVYAVAPPKEKKPKTKPSEDNFETMPESEAKPGAESTPAPKKLPSASAAPIGMKVTAGSNSLTKIADGTWKGSGPKFDHPDSVDTGSDAWADTLFEIMAMKNELSVSKVEVEKPKAAPKTAQSPAHKALVEKAKAVGDWLKTHTAPKGDALTALAHFQKHVGMQFWAKVNEKGELLVGSPNPDFAAAFTKELPGAQTVDTPIGPMFKTSAQTLLEASSPGEPVKGPDGTLYPHGTTFTTKTTETTVKDLLASEPVKIRDHKTDSALVLIKVSGQGEEQKAKLKEILEKYKLPTQGDLIQGQGNVIAFVPRKEIEKIGKTETITTPHVPDPPPPYSAPALPVASPTREIGSTATSSPQADLAMLPVVKPAKLGHAMLMGTPGVWRDFQVSARKVIDKDGNRFIEISGQLTNYNPKKGLLTAGSVHLPSATTKDTGFKGKSGETIYTVQQNEEGYHVEGKLNSGATLGGHKGKTDSGVEVKVIEDTPTFGNMFIARIPESVDAEAGFADALKLAGIDPAKAMAPVEGDNLRVYKKFAIVRSLMGPEGWNKALNAPKIMHDEAWLDEQLKAFGAEGEVDKATVKHTAEGHISVEMDDLKKLSHIKMLSRHNVDLGGLFIQLMGASGWSSRKKAMMQGFTDLGPGKSSLLNANQGMSGAADIQTGGANGLFFSPHDGMGHNMGNNQIFVHPRVLKRTDWFAFPSDNYGSIVSSSHGKPSNGLNRYDIKSYGEVVMSGGVALEDVAAVSVQNQSQKKELIKMLNKEGVTEVNGLPLEKFILTAGESVEPLMKRLDPK